jgi:hypothetical protein
MDELLKGVPQGMDDKNESDDETDSWETWEPDPVDANPGREWSSNDSIWCPARNLNLNSFYTVKPVNCNLAK